MENVVHRLTLDLTAPDMVPRVEVQRDNARTLAVSLTQGGRPYWIAEGVTAVFSGRKADGTPLFNACTVEKNRIVYDFTAQTTNVPGVVECEILLYSGDERLLASPRFEIMVDDLIHQEGDVPESAPELDALTKMVSAGTAMMEDLQEALGEWANAEVILEQAEAAAQLAQLGAQEAGESATAAAGSAQEAATSAAYAQSHMYSSAGSVQAAEHAAAGAERESRAAADAATAAAGSAQEAAKSATNAEAAAKRAENSMPEWARQPQKPTYTAQEVGADPEGKAFEAVANHETNLAAHPYFHEQINLLRDRLNTALNSNDIDLDQLAEIVAYIRSNRTLIDAVTTSKVSVSDIVDNLVTNVANRPLSAAQGVVLKGLIDGLRTGKLDADELPGAVEDALAQAKASGEFDGEDGGHYTPTVAQPAGDAVLITFTPNKASMPAVEPVTVKLPAGSSDSGQNPTDKLALTSPDGTVWNITVSNDGVITATRATEDGGEETVTFTIPVVNLSGNLTGISGDDYVNVMCHYLDSVNSVEFTDYAEIAYQGSSSMNFTNMEDGVDKAKNYKIKLYTDEARESKSKRVFKDWFATNNFHIKANYGDCTNFMNNMMMHFLTKSYQYLTPLPRAGARYTVDGFPVLLYINDVFCGIRFWNLKQDDKVYNLNEEKVDESGNVTQEADLCYQIGLNNGSSSGDNSGSFIYGNLNSGSNAGKNFADAHAEIDYYWEDRVWDKTGDHPDVLYNTIQWVSEATADEFKANLEQYFDKEYLINYFVMMMTCGMGDSACKNFNMLYFSDAGKWYATFWDMDFAFGTYWTLGTVGYDIDILTDTRVGHSRLWEKLWTNFTYEIKAKYWELRGTVLTLEQLEDSINTVWGAITSDWIIANKEAKYGGTAHDSKFKTDGASYVKTWATNRLAYMDTVMATNDSNLTTSLTLDADTLTFTTDDTQKLIATVTPSNSTQPVVWTSSNTAVAKVADGVVTPVKKGSCEITATSGNYSAVCAVTVEIEAIPGYSAGYINDSGEITSLANNYVSNNFDAADTVTVIKTPVAVTAFRIAEYDANKNFISRKYTSIPDGATETLFTLNSDTRYVRVGFQVTADTDLDNLFANYSVGNYNASDIAVRTGTYDFATGELISSSARICTNGSIVVSNGSKIINASTAEIFIRLYDSDGAYITTTNTIRLSHGSSYTVETGETKAVKVVFDTSSMDAIAGKYVLVDDVCYTIVVP